MAHWCRLGAAKQPHYPFLCWPHKTQKLRRFGSVKWGQSLGHLPNVRRSFKSASHVKRPTFKYACSKLFSSTPGCNTKVPHIEIHVWSALTASMPHRHSRCTPQYHKTDFSVNVGVLRCSNT